MVEPRSDFGLPFVLICNAVKTGSKFVWSDGLVENPYHTLYRRKHGDHFYDHGYDGLAGFSVTRDKIFRMSLHFRFLKQVSTETLIPLLRKAGPYCSVISILICRLEPWIQPLKFAMMVFIPTTVSILCYCKVYVILRSRQTEVLERKSFAMTPAAREEARSRYLQRRSKSSCTDGSRYRAGRCSEAREHTNLRRRRSSVISPLVLMNNKQRKEVRRLRRLARRIIWMVVIKVVAQYPIALFYLLKSHDNPRPMTNLFVLLMHFSSALFNSVSTAKLLGTYWAPKRNGRQHDKYFNRGKVFSQASICSCSPVSWKWDVLVFNAISLSK